ncbi:WD domain, G-beta repeat-containing protein, partial [Cardiosporidium cionae]
MLNSLHVTYGGGIWISNKPTIFYDQKCILIYRKQWILAICAESGKTLLKQKAHEDTITSLIILKEHAVSPLLLTTALDGTLKVWSLQKKEQNEEGTWTLTLLQTETITASAIVAATAITESPGKFYLVAQLPSRTPNSIFSEKMAKQPPVNIGTGVLEVMEVTVAWKQHTLSSSSPPTHPRLRKGKTHQGSLCVVETKTLFSHSTNASVESLATSHSGDFLAVAAGRELIVYACPFKAHIAFFHEARIKCMCMHPLDSFIVTGDYYGRITRWFCLSKNLFQQHSLPSAAGVETGVCGPPEAISLASFAGDGLQTAGCVGALTVSAAASSTDDPLSLPVESASPHLLDNEKPTLLRKICATATAHWHSHAVNCLAFTSDGAYLLSGGEEAVLVLWMFGGGIEEGTRQFLPRLGAPLVHIALDHRSPQYYFVACLDNSIKIIDGQYSKVLRSLQGIDVPINPQEWLQHASSLEDDEYEEGLSLDSPTAILSATFRSSMSLSVVKAGVDPCTSLLPSSSYHYAPELPLQASFSMQWLDRNLSEAASMPPILLINAHGKRIQLYDSVTDCHLLHFYTQKRQYTSRVNHLFGTEWKITQVAFSSDGQTFVTASSRRNLCNDGITTLESISHRHSFDDISNESKEKFVLHFWLLKKTIWKVSDGENDEEGRLSPSLSRRFSAAATDEDFELQTRVDTSHSHTITALLAHPTDSNFFISLSLDSQFKGWRCVELKSTPKVPSSAWLCVLVGSFRNLPCICGTLSMDGSVLAISQGNLITLWNPHQNSLIDCLVIPQPLQKDSHKETNSTFSICCTHVGMIESTYGPFLVATTQSSVIVWNLVDYSICFSQHFQGVVDLLFVEPSGGFHFAVVSAYQEEWPTHQMDIFSIHPAHANPSVENASKQFCAVKCIHSEKRTDEDTFILSGCFQAPFVSSLAPVRKQNVVGEFEEEEEEPSSSSLSTVVVCLTSAFALQTHRMVYSPTSLLGVEASAVTEVTDPSSKKRKDELHPDLPSTLQMMEETEEGIVVEEVAGILEEISPEWPNALRLHLLGTEEAKETAYTTSLCQGYLSNCSRIMDVFNPRKALLKETLSRKGPSHLAPPPTVTLHLLLKTYARKEMPLPLDTFKKAPSEQSSDTVHSSMETSSLDRLDVFSNWDLRTH